MSKDHKFSLQQYSGMAGALLLMNNNLSSQAVYTDIDPDIILQLDNETAGVDMDNDGDYDFAFLKASHYWSSSIYSDYEFRHILLCDPYGVIGNEIAGEYATNGAGGGTTSLPYALITGNLINNFLSFQYGGYQLMGIGFYKIEDSLWSWHYGIGKWNPNIDSAYLGVRFIDSLDCRHYGWIRCSTIDSAKTLIIHDYAYESKCETGIIAGDIIGDTTVAIENFLEINANVYSFDKKIFIQIEDFMDKTLNIYNITGKVIISKQLTEIFTTIDMFNETSGVYFVTINNGKNKFVKKLMAN